jgi:hypothetical protein
VAHQPLDGFVNSQFSAWRDCLSASGGRAPPFFSGELGFYKAIWMTFCDFINLSGSDGQKGPVDNTQDYFILLSAYFIV